MVAWLPLRDSVRVDIQKELGRTTAPPSHWKLPVVVVWAANKKIYQMSPLGGIPGSGMRQENTGGITYLI